MQYGTLYTVRFATAVCLVCSVVVCSAAVLLNERQQENKLLDKQKKLLMAVGLMQEGESLPRDEINTLFQNYIESRILDLETGEYDATVDATRFDQRRAAKDPATSRRAPENLAKVLRIPNHATVFLRVDDGQVRSVVLPIEGMGLWSTLYGYLVLDPDATTIRAITFYEHGETPGLGAEVDNPRWKALWNGRKAFDEMGQPRIQVIKGRAGPPSEDPYRVDGLSGATLTARGVSHMLAFWLGPDGFGPYLSKLRKERRSL